MAKNILTYFGQKSLQFMQQWQYLLLQEKCRLCRRFIHPWIKNMDLRSYVPPAVYFVAGKEIVSDALCQLCLNQLATSQSSINTHQYESGDGQLNELLIASAAAFEEPLNTVVYKFKYDGDVLLAKDLACLMVSAWTLLKERNIYLDQSVCLVPVPLHRKRQRKRGFNQAELLAWRLGRLLNIKIDTKSLKRIINTTPQQELGKSERVKNVAGAFRAAGANAFANRHVILVDDVCTSGSTLMACSQAVMAGGALSVCALTVAYVP